MYRSFALTLAAALAAPPLAAACPDSIATKLSTQVTPALDRLAADGRFSGVVLVACDGRSIYEKAYGMADRAKGIPNRVETRFNLGSMNKMWTAIAIAQLVEEGKVDVNAPVGRYLPDLPNAALRDSVLVRHLLTHTSGLGSYFQRGYLRDRVPLARAADLQRFFVDDPLAFSPGARFQYSNAGFAVLGMIVERVSGQNYFDYMRTSVLARAQMRTAAFLTLPITDAAVAVGYATPPGASSAMSNAELVERSSSPAGGAYASAQDMVAFSRALWSGRLVPAARVAEFTAGKVDMGGLKYAYGFGEGVFGGWREVGHNGGAPGVSTDFKSFPDRGLDLVVLANIDEAANEAMPLLVGAITGMRLRMARDEPGPGMPRGPSASAAGAGSASTVFPDSPIGRRAAAFLEASNAGTAAMERFIAEQMVPNDATPAERAARGAPMRERNGKLRLIEVIAAAGDEIVFIVESATEGRLEMRMRVEAASPQRVVGVMVGQMR
ncbi:MAG: beta-lactamase family protein [Gemmatimonadaceae bacterium]|nr:beta-lactamase family protein [Gemmatimonadaceae bacterium]